MAGVQAVLLAGVAILSFAFEAKHNFCDIAEAINNKSRTPKDGLVNKHLTLVMAYSEFKNTSVNNNPTGLKCTSDGPPKQNQSVLPQCTGFLRVVLDEAARIAGFTYDIVVEGMGSNISGTNWLKVYGRQYDLVVGTWSDTVERRQAGFVWPAPLIDTSPRLIINVEVPPRSSWDEMTTFLMPFSDELWGTIVAIGVGTALFMWWFEGSQVMAEDASDTELDPTARHFLKSVWLAFCQFCGSASFVPQTPWGRLTFFSYSFFIAIVFSAYTANLAACLTVKGSTDKSRLTGFEDAKHKREKICAQMQNAMGTTLRSWGGPEMEPYFVDITNMPNSQISDLLASGACSAVAQGDSQSKAALVDKNFNNDCKYDIVGERLLQISAGVVQDLFTHSCPNVILGALTSAIKQMNDNRFLDTETKKANAALNTLSQPCGGQGSEPLADINSLTLGVQQMTGILVVHCGLLIIAACGWFSTVAVRRFRTKCAKGAKQEPEDKLIVEVYEDAKSQSTRPARSSTSTEGRRASVAHHRRHHPQSHEAHEGFTQEQQNQLQLMFEHMSENQRKEFENQRKEMQQMLREALHQQPWPTGCQTPSDPPLD